MATIEDGAQVTIRDLLDEEALIEEARERARGRRHRRVRIAVILVASACAAVFGIVHRSASPTRTSGDRPSASATVLTCPDARVKLLGVSALNGAAVYSGVLVRASVVSSPACTMSGYPIVGADLTSHATAVASMVRATYLGGGLSTAARLPRLSMTSRARVVSFTLEFVTGNGPTCPRVNSITITLPGTREVLTTRPIFNAGGLALPMKFIYCGDLQVTPLVDGASGRAR